MAPTPLGNQSLEGYKVKELRVMARKRKIPFYYKMKKRDLQVALVLYRITERENNYK
jgi:hypothetical protein